MKKYFSYYISLVLLFVSLAVAPVQAADVDLNVRVDPRIELLSAVQLLSGYDKLTNYDTTYKEEMKDYFSEYQDHPAVKMFSQMKQEGFNYHVPPGVMIHLSEPPELIIEEPIGDKLKNRAGGDEKLQKFIEELRNFAQESNFTTFFNNHKSLYQSHVGDVQQKIKNSDIATLELYYGKHQASYNIILAPLFHSGGYGARIQQWESKYDIYSIQGPSRPEEESVTFGTEESFRRLVWHEFGHSFVNPVVGKNRKLINQYRVLFRPIADQMSERAYGNWETCVQEHLVRAVVARLKAIRQGAEVGEWKVAQEEEKGFKYIRPLYNKLKKYESNRTKYQNFADFYPELLEVFKKEAEGMAYSFDGTIESVLIDRNSMIAIVPTAEKSNQVESEIKQYVKWLQEKTSVFPAEMPVITDQQALNRDLADKMIITLGTVEGNQWLAKYKDKFPGQLKEDKIIVDGKTYNGTNLQFVTAWTNPQNKKKEF